MKNFEAFECFVGLHELQNTSSDHVVKALKLILTACDFDFSKIRGQCYDGASSMSGYKTGVKTQILSENKKSSIYSLLQPCSKSFYYGHLK